MGAGVYQEDGTDERDFLIIVKRHEAYREEPGDTERERGRFVVVDCIQ